MAQMKVVFLVVTLAVTIALNTSAKPLENDGAEIVMKIEKINEQLPGVQARQKDNSTDDAKPKKKSSRNYPVYYVNTKVNGKFGKSMRAFTSEEFLAKYPIKD